MLYNDVMYNLMKAKKLISQDIETGRFSDETKEKLDEISTQLMEIAGSVAKAYGIKMDMRFMMSPDGVVENPPYII